MLGINTNSGVYDAVGLIESIVLDLNRIEVRGVENMKIIFESIGKLDALKKVVCCQKEGEADGNINSQD